MKRHWKVGITIVAALALVGSAASGVSASQFKSANYPATITGAQEAENIFTIEGGLTTKCKIATFVGSITAAAETLNLVPYYSECTSFGLSVGINFGKCAYLLKAGAGAADSWAGAVDIVCESGAVTLTTFTCELEIPAQGLGPIAYGNNTGLGSVTVKTNLTGIAYNKTKDGFLCPLNGTGAKSDGRYEGNIATKGSNGTIYVG